MLKKALSFIIIVALFIFMAGCGTDKSTENELQNKTGAEVSKKTEQEISSPAQKQIEPDAGSVDQKAEVVNNNQTPSYTENGDYPTGTIHILTEDDLQKALSQLVKKGYLTGAGVNSTTFRAALSQYQKDQGLTPTGKLDGETFAKLTSE